MWFWFAFLLWSRMSNMHFLAICTSFENCLFRSFAYLFIGLMILWEFSFLSSLYILVINLSSKIKWEYSWNITSSSYKNLSLGVFHWSTCLLWCHYTILFLLLWLCSIVWSQVLWYLQCCSFCFGCLMTFVFPYEL
jgi:hypothetical protein